MILVGSVAGGTASNVMAYLAKANVPLSITMTAISTLLGVILTPLLVRLYAGAVVAVDVKSMIMSLVKIVLIPVAGGMLLRILLHKLIDQIENFLALIAMLAIVYIIGIVVGLNNEKILSYGIVILLAVVLHNSAGLVLGYSLARITRCDKKDARTIALEVGMQNSGLGVALATQFFADLTSAAIPGAIFSAWHNISGSLLAAFWGKREEG